ncbi:hypothetical protein FHS16_000389 [Paenibacillus endophyticus]|uniref:SLH domain-containing protein n=1 Tax=Paenibacillus endophyticus TaxID=1294268 RepID=A0A7W5G8X3_9BACL|nr:DUF4430 domain-containing protein [Paenibacillus endophyticus]MBB3150357.1 hypothetical protein [Paenibacillus endophyticus]
MLTLKKFMRKSLPVILSFVLIFSVWSPQVSKAADHNANASLNEMIARTVDYYKAKAKDEVLDSWMDIVALWGAGQNLNDGVWKLPSWKTTEPTGASKLDPNESDTGHIRYIYSLLAMGEDPAHAWGSDRNLYAELAAQQNTSTGAFGTPNKHMWAMHALETGEKLGSDVGDWNANAKQKAIDFLLDQQLADGGFAFFGSTSDPDMTGMGLLALGNYQNDSAVQQSIARIKSFLKTKQLNNERVMYGDNSNSMSAVVSGLMAVGEDLLSNEWMVDGKSVLDSYSAFQLQNGSFKWMESGTDANPMATNQALIALNDIKYQKSIWYRFAETKQPITVNLEVDGISDVIYADQATTVPQIKKPATALDALKNALDQAVPPVEYNIVDSSFGAYVKGIAGEEAGTFSGWDGWMYEVNGVAPNVGASAYQLQPNDKVRFYYSRYPAISTSATIEAGQTDPQVDITLVGDEFSEQANEAGNWSFVAEDSGLTVQSIEKVDAQQATIHLSGQASGKSFKIQALKMALEGKQDSNIVSIRVPIAAKLQVDGISGSIFNQQMVTIKNTEEPATALDLLKQALDQAAPKINYKIVDSSFGAYVSSINGEAAGTFGGWDGWMYEVNGVAPSVGASAYELKNDDVVRFYYSRWPAISTAAQIVNGATNPSVEVTLVGDEFTAAADDIANWDINIGSTELQVSSLVKDGNKVTIALGGTAKGGAVTIKALGAALVGGNDSESISVIVPRVISSNDDQTIAINENENAVLVTDSGTGMLTNNVKLTFESAALPKIIAERGNTRLEIPAHTAVTSIWNKELLLPKALNMEDSGLNAKLNTVLASSNKKIDSVDARLQIGGNGDIQFSQHVTLTIKGQGSKEAGFVDHAGVFTPIKKYADSTVQTDDVYAYSQNGDLIIQTKHFTEFLAYTTSALSTGGGGGLPIAQSITLSVEKRSINEADFVTPYAFTIAEGDTAFAALQKALDQKGLSLNYSGTGATIYVQAIGGLAQFDKGAGSGWMYSVNGVFPKVSAGVYTLKNGDVLRWQYTTNLGEDLGAPNASEENGGQQPGQTPTEYSDQTEISAWALEAVTKATELGFMNGTSTVNPKFEPKRQLTRAEFAALVVKYSGAEQVQADSGFKDVTKQNWYYGYVAAAKEKGLMSGVTGTTFSPNAPITRQEMAAVLVRLKDLVDDHAPQAAIKDKDAVSAWAIPFVNVAYQKGLMTGDQGMFNPQALVTREMAAVTIIRLHELK